MRNWLPALGVVGVALLALPLLIVMFLAERGLWQQGRAIRKTMVAGDRRTRRVVALAWVVSVLVAFGTVWAATGELALAVLGVAVGSAAVGVLGPMLIPGLRMSSRHEIAEGSKPEHNPGNT